eukprot:m51a1_g14140 hypothetical protein (647) ;mRNA; r:244500-247513
MLSVGPVSARAQGAASLAAAGDAEAALGEYVVATVLASRELLQAHGLSLYAATPDARQRLALDAQLLAGTAHRCLDAALALLLASLGPRPPPGPLLAPPPLPGEAALGEYVVATVLASRELLQAHGLSLYAATPDARQRLALDAQLLAGTAHRCLDAALALLLASLGPRPPPGPLLAPPPLPGQQQQQQQQQQQGGVELLPGVAAEALAMGVAAERLGALGGEAAAKVGAPVRELALMNQFLARRQAHQAHQAAAAAAPYSQAQSSDMARLLCALCALFASREPLPQLLWLARQQAENLAIARSKQIAAIREVFQVPSAAAVAAVAPEDADATEAFRAAVVGKAKQLAAAVNAKFTELNEKEQSARDYRQLIADGGDLAAVSANVKRMLTTEGHPLQRRCSEFTSDVLASAPHKTLQAVTKEVKDFLDTTRESVAAQFKLSSSGTGMRECHKAIAEVVFPAIFTSVFALYKDKYRQKSAATMTKLAELAPSITLSGLLVRRRFWLVPDGCANVVEAAALAYRPAIDSLLEMTTKTAPHDKSRCIVAASAALTRCVEQFYEGKSVAKESIMIGGDDIVPLLSFALTQASVPNVHAETAFITEFMTCWESADEEGYALATLMACIDFIDSLSLDELRHNESDSVDLDN